MNNVLQCGFFKCAIVLYQSNGSRILNIFKHLISFGFENMNHTSMIQTAT